MSDAFCIECFKLAVFAGNAAVSNQPVRYCRRRDMLLSVADKMLKGNTLPGTSCRYCVSHCPQQLNFPALIELYNEHCFTTGGGLSAFIAPMVLAAVPADKRPGACIGCESCEAVCPQQIEISKAMADFAARLSV